MKILNISYRLPISLKNENNNIIEIPTSGGLASSILSYAENSSCDLTWLGVANFERILWNERNVSKNKNLTIDPLFLTKSLDKNFYQGFSNSVLYPLFHYFPSFVEYKEEYFEAYKEANQLMASKVILNYKVNDIIWIHDYHFLPLAGLIRKELPEAKIGFFLHIPFPNIELIKLLPYSVQKYLFENLLNSNLIGFHTWDYTLHFIETVERLLGVSQNNFNLTYKNSYIKVGAYPISIDFDKFNNAYNMPDVRKKRNSILNMYENKKIIFSVDRLDYTKGILYRLNAFERFLEKYPEWKNRVVFILVVIPSREEISKYTERKSLIELAVSRINGKLGNYNWSPIIFQYQSVDFSELIALYTASNMALISPVRDGMNLVAKEFIASRKDKMGVLLLSEMTGAAKELQDAIIFHPLDTNNIADCIKQGLEMPLSEQEVRMTIMQHYLSQNTVFKWAENFIEDIEFIKNNKTIHLTPAIRSQLIEKYVNAKKRLILLDYDGTLTPFNIEPEFAIPSEDILNILKSLCNSFKNEVWLVSGRDKDFLDKHFGDININIVAEHGGKIKRNTWQSVIGENQVDWMDSIEVIFQEFVNMNADSFIERKQFSIVWHYRKLETRKGFNSSRELLHILKSYAINKNLFISDGNMTIEVKHHLANKGTICKNFILNNTFDWVVAIGDDNTDEDLFMMLNETNHHTIKIGTNYTNAKYRLGNIELAKSFLNLLQFIH